jgi:hypothetical protein
VKFTQLRSVAVVQRKLLAQIVLFLVIRYHLFRLVVGMVVARSVPQVLAVQAAAVKVKLMVLVAE